MKVIIVPRSQSGLEKLNFNCHTNEDIWQLNLTDGEVDSLFRVGFFSHINQALNIDIDDFEDEAIVDYRKLLIMKNILKDYLRKNDKYHYIYHDVYHLVTLALEKETGIFFFL